MSSTYDVAAEISKLNIPPDNMYQIQLTDDDCETAEEVRTETPDSEDSTDPLRYSTNLEYSTNSNDTLTPQSVNGYDNVFNNEERQINFEDIQIPIVGYEVMEERARFTVFKLRVENKSTGDCWYVFRRYTDFVRLCTRLKHTHPKIVLYLPRKRWFKDNFEPAFLEERVSGLQTLVNAILSVPELVQSSQIQDFFCLNEPPVYSETNEESRAMFEALEDTIYQLKQQLKEKEDMVDKLEDRLHAMSLENENLKKVIAKSATITCQKCQKDDENTAKVINNNKPPQQSLQISDEGFMNDNKNTIIASTSSECRLE